jgi:glutamine amidotransferase
MIAVVDYGVNNLKSVVRALAAGGHGACLTSKPEEVRRAERVLVPGVGNFGQGSRNLKSSGLGEAVRQVAQAGRPVMGICLGLQLFFDASTELHVPHVGWAQVDLTEQGKQHPVLAEAFRGSPQFFYHVHSYYPTDLAQSHVLGTGEYGVVFPTLVGRESVIGAQFHPEKSQQAGIALLSAFAEWRP